jgi:hypothetical protein
MKLVADGFIIDPDQTDEDNKDACLELIEATEEPGSRLASLFEAKVVPPADDEGVRAKSGHEGPCNKLVF